MLDLQAIGGFGLGKASYGIFVYIMKRNLPRFASISQSAKADLINILVIIVIWAVMVILVNPLGDFPLNDDWAFGRSVQSVVEKGDFQLSDWGAMNLFSQVFWGALFCLPFGFSFTALRFSTLTLGLIGVMATYGLLREANSNPKISLLGALLVAINPIYFGLSNTFMTDVPFFSFATLSLFFLLRWLRYNLLIEVIIGILMACIALLIRQLGLAIFMAFGCAYIIKKGVNVQNFIKGFLPTLLGLSIQILYQKWLQFTDRLPAMYGTQIKGLVEAFYKGFAHVIFYFTGSTLVALVYLGLFIFPLIIILFSLKFKKLDSRQQSLALFALSTFFVVVMGIIVSNGKRMPLTGNIITDFGLGPLTLRDSFILKALSTPTVLQMLWLVITAIGVVGAALLLEYLFFALMQTFAIYKKDEVVDKSKNWLTTLIISFILIYFLPLGPQGFFDRYLLLLLPLLMMLVSVSTTNISNWKVDSKVISIALIMMLLYGGFTIGATHDYLSWNRVRWQALHSLMQESQISPNQIDGGFEFNGWYLYDDFKYKQKPDKSWWWVDNDDYIISFGPITGYEEVKRYPFSRWLPFGQENIFVLHKNTDLKTRS